jgi:twitching motility protein PilI
MLSAEVTNLRGLTEQPFALLHALDQRLQARLVDTGASELADAWVGLGFNLGNQTYLAPQREIREVITVPKYSRIPNAKPWLLGIANVRGSLLPLVDLRQLIDGKATELSRSSRFMVLNSDEIPAGFLVDGVSGYRRFGSYEQRNDLLEQQSEHWREYMLGSFVREQQAYLVFSFMKLAMSDIFQNASA